MEKPDQDVFYKEFWKAADNPKLTAVQRCNNVSSKDCNMDIARRSFQWV